MCPGVTTCPQQLQNYSSFTQDPTRHFPPKVPDNIHFFERTPPPHGTFQVFDTHHVSSAEAQEFQKWHPKQQCQSYQSTQTPFVEKNIFQITHKLPDQKRKITIRGR